MKHDRLNPWPPSRRWKTRATSSKILRSTSRMNCDINWWYRDLWRTIRLRSPSILWTSWLMDVLLMAAKGHLKQALRRRGFSSNSCTLCMSHDSLSATGRGSIRTASLSSSDKFSQSLLGDGWKMCATLIRFKDNIWRLNMGLTLDMFTLCGLVWLFSELPTLSFAWFER